MKRVNFADIRRVSWGSIFGGVITVLAISILLSILATSIGLFQFDPTSDSPTSGIGTTIGITTVISLILSLAAGGFVAGKLAGADGIIHGFLVWATSLIVTLILGVFLTIGAVKLTTNILGSVASVTGDVISGVGSVVESGASGLANQAENVFGDIDFTGEVDGNEVRKDIRDALRKSGVKEFQPEYLQRQMKGVKTDFDKSLKKLIMNPNDADDIVNKFLDRVKTRTDKAFADVNRDDLSRAIANNSNMSKAEVDKTVDEYIELINNARQEGREQIQNLEESIEQAKQDWEQMKQNAMEEVDKASSAAGRSALISFFAILIGGVICAFAGMFGAKKTMEGYEV